MNRAVFSLVVAASLLLSACASTGAVQRESRTSVPGDDTDVNKVATVNRWAYDRGATVVWVNFPQKPKSSPIGGSNP
jgi:hypothetical protein